MSKRVKRIEVDALVDRIQGIENCVLVGYKGLTAEGAVDLRRRLKQNDVELRVVKNSLATTAFREVKLEGLEAFLDGETAIAIAHDPVSAPKTLEEWRKQNKVIELRGGMVEGRTVDAEAIKTVAAIPSRDELLSRLLGSFQAPATGLVTVLTGLQRKLLYGLNALIEKKEKES